MLKYERKNYEEILRKISDTTGTVPEALENLLAFTINAFLHNKSHSNAPLEILKLRVS